MRDCIVKVLIDRAIPHNPLYYKSGDLDISPGKFVEIPIGKKSSIGVVWEICNECDISKDKIKLVISILESPPLSEQFRKFIDFVARYTFSNPGLIFKMIGYYKSDHDIACNTNNYAFNESKFDYLSEDQKNASDFIVENIKENRYSATLLRGVTGSGKTDVYLSTIEFILSQDSASQALIMLPEIALTNQLMCKIEDKFGIIPTQWHSNLTPRRRKENWLAVSHDNARIIIGARSALFLPYKNLKMIVVDEEHDSSFKQEENVIYNARDMAVARAHCEDISIILSSATPSIETAHNVENKKYSEVALNKRFGCGRMPKIELIDMKNNRSGERFISSITRKAIKDELDLGRQCMIFLNRRGYAPLLLCAECGYRFSCPHCSVFLVEHRHIGKLCCHHCGYKTGITHSCPDCKKTETFISCGPGVERIKESIDKLFPTARIALMTSDSINTQKKAKNMINDINSGEINIIIGTQLISKGHHFPNLSLVCIIDADSSLFGCDLRSSEKTYQAIHQVSGRAGRESIQGKVLIQTYIPENKIIRSIAFDNQDDFYKKEMEGRKLHNMPPFCTLIAIIVKSKKEKTAENISSYLAQKAKNLRKEITVLGPTPSSISMIGDWYRYRILIKCDKKFNIQNLMNSLFQDFTAPYDVRIKIDVDPINFV